MTLSPKELVEALERICTQGPGWEEAAKRLWDAGREVLPFVLERLAEEQAMARQSLSHYPRVLQLTRILPPFRSGRTLAPLLQVMESTGDPEVERAFHELLRALIARHAAEDAQAIADLLRLSGASGLSQVFVEQVSIKNRLRLATALVEIAEQEPHRCLREALPLLRTGLANPSAPLEFFSLQRRLKRALHTAALPIPAELPELSVADLPIPLGEERA